MDGMIDWLGAAYPWVKAAHLIFVIFWIAGLFMLPRYPDLSSGRSSMHGFDRGGLRWVDRESASCVGSS